MASTIRLHLLLLGVYTVGVVMTKVNVALAISLVSTEKSKLFLSNKSLTKLKEKPKKQLMQQQIMLLLKLVLLVKVLLR